MSGGSLNPQQVAQAMAVMPELSRYMQQGAGQGMQYQNRYGQQGTGQGMQNQNRYGGQFGQPNMYQNAFMNMQMPQVNSIPTIPQALPMLNGPGQQPYRPQGIVPSNPDPVTGMTDFDRLKSFLRTKGG